MAFHQQQRLQMNSNGGKPFHVAIVLLGGVFSSTAFSAINPLACTTEAYKQADTDLNRVYKQVFERVKVDTNRLSRLKASQRQWLKFRDFEVESFTSSSDGGSIHSACVCSVLARLERERIAQLEQYLGGEEGDGCKP
jgi:uncharacterized protein YecT (DUF1311 family)